jgi:hypothetical protein
VKKLSPHWLAILFSGVAISLATSVQALAHLKSGRTFDPEVGIEKRYPHTKGGYQIWLINAKQDTEELLYTTQRNAEPMFGTDMKWLIINDAEGSGSTRCKLFRRNGGRGSVKFELVEDITDRAWKFFQQETGKDPSGLHHDYVRGRCWLEDPNVMVISLIGHGDPGHYYVRYWICVFDPETKKFSTDLAVINEGRVVD